MGNNDNCRHSNRVPCKQLRYRCISTLFIELLKFSSFQKLINYSWNYDKENETHDVSDRIKYTSNMNEMHKLYLGYCTSNNLSNVVEISILLSWFYDGIIQLFKKKSATFQPLLITISLIYLRIFDIRLELELFCCHYQCLREIQISKNSF